MLYSCTHMATVGVKGLNSILQLEDYPRQLVKQLTHSRVDDLTGQMLVRRSGKNRLRPPGRRLVCVALMQTV